MGRALSGLVGAISSYALISNSTWPLVSFPRWEEFAGNARRQGQIEVMALAVRVPEKQRNQWLEFFESVYERDVREGHIIASKHSEDMYDNGTFVPNGYHANISMKDPDTGGFITNEYSTPHWPISLFTPPPSSFEALNLDYASEPMFKPGLRAVLDIRNETIFTKAHLMASYKVAYSEQQHNSREKATGIPHSGFVTAVHRDPDDEQSDIVALLTGGFTWDAPFVQLLPPRAKGLVAVIHNNCGQEYTFRIDGADVFFVANSDMHDPQYDSHRMLGNLTKFESKKPYQISGHCIYQLVRSDNF